MKLQGSCHCGAVTFELESTNPYPYQLCYCSICSKTQGGGGYAINLGGDAKTLSVEGRENISVYNAKIHDPDSSSTKISSANRRFCKKCGSFLWLDDPTCRTGSSVCISHRYRVTSPSGENSFDARFQSSLGATDIWSEGQEI